MDNKYTLQEYKVLIESEKTTEEKNKSIFDIYDNSTEAIKARQLYTNTHNIQGTMYETLSTNATNRKSKNKIFILNNSEQTENPNIKPDTILHVQLFDYDKDLLNKPNKTTEEQKKADDIKAEIDKYNKNISIDGVELIYDSDGKLISAYLNEIKDYHNSMGNISTEFKINKEPLVHPSTLNDFVKKCKKAGISEDIIDRTINIKPIVQNTKVKGTELGYVKEENSKWKFRVKNKNIKVIEKNTKNKTQNESELDNYDGYNLRIYTPKNKVKKVNMTKLCNKICERTDKGHFKFDEDNKRLLINLKPLKKDFNYNDELFEQATKWFKLAYGHWLKTDTEGDRAFFISDSDYESSDTE